MSKKSLCRVGSESDLNRIWIGSESNRSTTRIGFFLFECCKFDQDFGFNINILNDGSSKKTDSFPLSLELLYHLHIIRVKIWFSSGANTFHALISIRIRILQNSNRIQMKDSTQDQPRTDFVSHCWQQGHANPSAMPSSALTALMGIKTLRTYARRLYF